MPLQDVKVTIDVAYPAPRIGLGRPAIFTQQVGAGTYKEYSTLEALTADFDSSTEAYKKAEVIFRQPNRPDQVAVATYETDIGTALAQYYNRAWHFALVAGDVSADQVAAASFINDKDFKFLAVQVKDDAGREAVKGKKRTLVFDHNVSGEHLDAATVGNLGSLSVGSITWKFKQVVGITPRYLTDTEIVAIDEDSAIAYVVKAGRPQLSEGWLSDGEYIDVVHGKDWIKVDMENEVQNVLAQAEKLPYDARGINAIEAAATTTLLRGFNNGIIAAKEDKTPDFTISALTREQSDPQDRSTRVYRGLHFEFGLAGAIHEARVTGSIRV
ncbi:hypothetical protein AWM68_17225 [Fictibacillus phosphorivorans]|uniref:DUF3383 family protein n=1 Tax=Fictibacillus phosphorivorans TaxID=1221500 RepID=A0A163S3H3_9BACL|nr:DUF3383 family protein [Fictibacillus phosphorivorans]KZE68057.1 hypothetical protein AWM68_17225 [Fictibacillus phosphorivorans]